LFGGREAEEELLGRLTIGSGHDLERATDIARALVQSYGLQPNGALEVRAFGRDEQVSERTREIIDAEIRALLDRERTRARTIIQEHRDELVALRDLLIAQKVIDAKGLRKHVPDAKHPPEAPTED
jgi:cell division protease FtsH